MEAKDTVMSNDKIILKEIRVPTGERRFGKKAVLLERDIDIDATLLAQAEISFKAGYQAAVEKMSFQLPARFKKAKQAGIKEVVEWIEEGRLGRFVTPEEWQAKLQEWGIKEEKKKGFTDEELKDLHHHACDDTIG